VIGTDCTGSCHWQTPVYNGYASWLL
jgi:nitrate reductase alpha subunit